MALLAAAACTETESATNLNPDGPPKIEQVRLREVLTGSDGSLVDPALPVFAFGTHPEATADQEHAVTSAKATKNPLRVILSELLMGNRLEEIASRGQIDDDAYDTIPDGTTPDDIAKCAVSKDVLPQSCTGAHAVCLCKLDGGCGGVAKGAPVGVLDVNQDGAADDTRFMAGAVGIRCGTIDVPIDLQNSYWNPSGNQEPPATGGFDAMGPAIVLQPLAPCTGCDFALPTNLTCGLTFAANVVDKTGNKVCAPPEGRPASCAGNLDKCVQSCTAGDVSAFTFKVEPLTVTNNSFADNATGVDRTSPVVLLSRAPLKASTLTAITVTENGTQYTNFTTNLASPQQIRINWTAGLAANTPYVITVSTALTDMYDQPIVSALTYHFTTGP